MKWWNDLWLNEGFATFMKFKASQVVHPDWDVVCIWYIIFFVSYYSFLLSVILLGHIVSDSLYPTGSI